MNKYYMIQLSEVKEVNEVKEVKGRYLLDAVCFQADILMLKLLSFNFPKRAWRANFFNFFNFQQPATSET
jgi:hypothetical protein